MVGVGVGYAGCGTRRKRVEPGESFMPALLACDSVRGMAMAYLSLMPRVDRLFCVQMITKP